MSNGKLVYKCEWLNTTISPIRIYRKDNGTIKIIGGLTSKLAHTPEITLKYILGEFNSAFNSQYGWTKKVYINTEEFKKMYGSDNIYKILKSRGFL